MKKICFLFAIVFITCCSKETQLTENDKKYIMTYEDFTSNRKFDDYKLTRFGENEDYIFKKMVFSDIFSAYYTFSILDKNKQNMIFSIDVYNTINQEKANEIFISNKKNNNSNFFRHINLDDFECLDGFYMVTPSMQHLFLKRKYSTYSISIVGTTDIDLTEYKNIIKNKCNNLETIKN